MNDIVVKPNNVMSIGDGAFYGCDKLVQTENGVRYVDKWVIDCDNSVKSVKLRSDTVGIGYQAFRYCADLASIIMSNSVKFIGESSVAHCGELTSIILPKCVTNIDNYAFWGCKKLSSIVIPESVTRVGAWAFFGCSNIMIYCEAKEKPYHWDSEWNQENRPVVWGYKK